MFFFIKKQISFFLLILLFCQTKCKDISFAESVNQICSLTTYDNKSVTDECLAGPSKKTRILNYQTFESYIQDHSFKENGLAFYSSLYVDTDFHNFGDFMNSGMVIYVLIIISIVLLAVWIPIICCWKHEVCLFDECCIRNNCCFILLNIFIYIILVAILSFIIVGIIFAE